MPTTTKAESPLGASEVGIRIYRPGPTDYNLKFLGYGDPGVGKTTLMASAVNCPAMQKVLLVNIEGGIMSVIEAEEAGLQDTPDVIELGAFKELQQILWYLRNEDHPYRTLIIDSLSELAQKNLDIIVETETARNSKRNGDVDNVWLEDYGKSTQQMRRTIREFRDLPMHVLFTCHAASSKDQHGVEQVFPALTPKLRTSVLGYMDVVGFMYTTFEEPKEEGEDPVMVRKLLTRPYGKWIAKDRSPGGRLGMTMTNPTMTSMLDRINRHDSANEGK